LQIPADFPLLGVGLGAWPEIFPHYQSPPWSTNARPREAHNDYLQLLSEMGALGLLMMLWLVGGMAIRIYRSRTAVSSRLLPAIAALLAGIGVMAFHEFFDFSLKIPANAILFSALLAIAMRAIFLESNDEKPGSRVAVRLFACGTFATCAMLLLGSMGQDKVPYPYNVSPPASTSDARKLISAHPAGSVFHQQLYDLIEKTEPARSMSELEIALWLDPINPYTRDQYARRLLIEHNQQAGYCELALSVENSPAASTHAYLHPRLTALLTERESAAVEQGFTAAVAHDYPGAVEALGQFYGQAGRFEDEGKLFEEAATRERDATTSLRYLLLSGMAYVQAGDSDKGEGLFRRVSSADPTNPLPYQDLALLVFAQRKDLKGAKAAVIEGIEKGAEPYPLWIALAEMAEKIGERNEARAAMHKALEIKSDSYEANFYLAMLYFTDHDFEHAAEFFGKAAAVQPNSAYALFSLGVAEESRYHFYEAEQAYVRAVRLEPDNSSYQKYLDHLRIRQAQNKS
jgi:tetratricopeptide (TPR) repeat protein